MKKKTAAAAAAALAVAAFTGCAAQQTTAPAYDSPVLTWHDADSDGKQDTLITTSHGCATDASFYDVHGGFTGYRVEAGSECMSASEITETLVSFINENGGI